MALKILYRGHNNTYFDLVDGAFTQQNWQPGLVNDTIDAQTKNGVLGGSLAGIYGAALIGMADKDHRPLGWYVNDALADPFDNQPAIASGKGVFLNTPGSMFQIDVFETHTIKNAPAAAAPAALTYAAGDILYCSPRGLATKEVYAADADGNGNSNNVDTLQVGIVVEPATADRPFMTVMSLI